MIKSMTGYGLATGEFANAKFTVEIKSLNSKFLELAIKLPKSFADKELMLRNECNKLIERGKVNITITVESSDSISKAASINQEVLMHYYRQLKAVATQLDDPAGNLLQMALNFPEVISYPEDSASEEEWTWITGVFNEAMLNFQRFRADEGTVLEKDITMRIQNILSALDEVERLAPKRIPVVRERIKQLAEDYLGKENIDQNRFEQKLIFYIDKLDITEEQVRLRSHCNYFIPALQSPEANGKKLGLIAQEIGREINTIGSKANDADMQQTVVRMKEELEKIKEQLLNVL